MNRRLIGAALSLALLVPVYAIAQTVTRNSLTTYNNTFIGANGRGAISGQIGNAMNSQFIAGFGVLADTNNWSGSNTFTGSVTLPASSVSIALGQLPSCGSPCTVAPVPNGQAYQEADGLIFISPAVPN